MDCKKRSANFNVKEESLLVALVKKYREILECKLTDMRTHNEKAECWAKIEVEFNGASGEAYRPKDVLRKKYDNIKKRVKKKYSDEKCHLRGTGGGPPQKIKFTDIDVEIKEILGVRIEGNESEFDGDADVVMEEKASLQLDVQNKYHYDVIEVMPQEAVHNLDSDMQNVEVEVPFEDHDYTVPASSSNNGVFETVATLKKNDDCNSSCTVSNASTSWAKYTPKMLRAKKSQCLQAGGNDGKRKRDDKGSIRDKVSQWAYAKSQLEEAKTKFLHEEQQLKLQFMRERHEQEMKLTQQKVELEMTLMQEEHRMKMEILELQKNKIKK